MTGWTRVPGPDGSRRTLRIESPDGRWAIERYARIVYLYDHTRPTGQQLAGTFRQLSEALKMTEDMRAES